MHPDYGYPAPRRERIVAAAKIVGVSIAARLFSVSTRSIHRWIRKVS